MPCEEHDRLLQSLVHAMGAEDRTRDSGWVAARISVSKRLADQQSAHSAVVGAEYVINKHIDDCETCRADGRKHHNATVGQF